VAEPAFKQTGREGRTSACPARGDGAAALMPGLAVDYAAPAAGCFHHVASPEVPWRWSPGIGIVIGGRSSRLGSRARPIRARPGDDRPSSAALIASTRALSSPPGDWVIVQRCVIGVVNVGVRQ